MDAVAIATRQDEAFRAACARLHVDVPFHGVLTLVSKTGKATDFRIGRVPYTEERIVDWRHPFAAAYYEIVQGRAGSGKTSVALHRVSWLTFAAEDDSITPVEPSRVLIVMFNKALQTFAEQSLVPLGLEAVRINTFHAWALDAVRKGYRGVVAIDQTGASHAEVAAALKKNVGMLAAIDAFVARQQRSVTLWLEEKLAPYKATGRSWLQRWKAGGTEPEAAASGGGGGTGSESVPAAGAPERQIVRRLIELRGSALRARDVATGIEQKRLAQIHQVFATAVDRTTQYKEELMRLLADEELLAAHLVGVSGAQIEQLAGFQRRVAAREGSERRPGPYVRFEDVALLLRLMQQKHGGLPDKSSDEVFLFDHLVVDEAQDFGAVELTVLLSSVRSRTGVTIVGDLNQKIVPDADFIGWDALASELGIGGAAVAKLEVAHRSTRPIMAIADRIVGDTTNATRPGPLPTFRRADDEDGVLAAIGDDVRSAIADNRNAHVCVVVRHKSDVDALAARLVERCGALTAVRVGHNKSFEFGPGVTVTNLRQVKGLEFDVVVCVEPSEANYPDTEAGRRNFYTLITRAKDRLHFVGRQEPCSILASAIEAGLLESREDDVPPLTLTDEDRDPL